MKEIKLSGMHGQGKVTLVDDEDYEELNKYRWHLVLSKSSGYYVRRSKCIGGRKGKIHIIQMHRVIMGLSDPKILVDHKDHNGLNNQRSNLRIATHSQNGANRRKKNNTTSKYFGVSITKITPQRPVVKYIGCCRNKNKVYTKSFNTEIEAALWYNEKAKELHGEFANLNIIDVIAEDVYNVKNQIQ